METYFVFLFGEFRATDHQNSLSISCLDYIRLVTATYYLWIPIPVKIFYSINAILATQTALTINVIEIKEIQKKYGNDFAAIVIACRVYFKTEELNELNRFLNINRIDWNKLVYQAKLHRIRPTVYPIFIQAIIPLECKELMQQEYLQLIQANWKSALETEKIILLLKKNEIDSVPYKGTAYSKQFFGDLVSRESSDIDLVISPSDLCKAIPILKTLGYTSELEDTLSFMQSKYFEVCKDFAMSKFENEKREFQVELHWGITNTYQKVHPKTNLLLRRTETGKPFSETELRIISPTAHFSAVLIHHGLMDNFKYLKNVIDIAQAMRTPLIRQERKLIMQTLSDLGLKKLTHTNELIIHDLLGITLFGLSESCIYHQTLANKFSELMCSGKLLLKSSLVRHLNSNKNRFLLMEVDWFSYNLANLKQALTPNVVDFSLIELSRPLTFLYYFIKPFRSLIKITLHYTKIRRVK